MNAAAAAGVLWHRSLDLPWAHHSNQDQRFRRIRRIVLLAVVLLSLLFVWLPAPEVPQSMPEEAPLPVELAMKLPRPPPPPPPLAVKPQEAPSEIKPTAPKRVVETPQREISPKPGSAPPGPNAHDRATAAGISDLAKELASLQDSSEASKAITGRADMTGKPNPNFTSDLNGGLDRGSGSERSMITSRAGQGSGGINNAGASRGFGSGGLAGRGTTQVAGYGGGGTGTGPGVGGRGGGGGNGTGTGGGNGTGSGSGGSRSHDEIELVFDRNKGALYAIYNRALRENAALQGKMVLQLTILPSGVVSACEVVSSELNDPQFEHSVVQRVLMFKFEARDVATVTATKPLDWFPQN